MTIRDFCNADEDCAESSFVIGLDEPFKRIWKTFLKSGEVIGLAILEDVATGKNDGKKLSFSTMKKDMHVVLSNIYDAYADT